VWLVDLTALSEPGLLAHTVAYTLGIQELPGQPIIQQLVRGIGSRNLLLLLDNCEHMVAACAGLITSLAERCSNLHVLMTSRETIGVNGEVVWQVPPLPVDSGADSTTDSVAAQLFADRASAIAPGFRLTADNASDIHQICARLDGLPLAIELAAARVRVLSPHQIAQRLDDRFALLTGASSKRGTTSPDAAGSG
jgi:predicted ATPase